MPKTTNDVHLQALSKPGAGYHLNARADELSTNIIIVGDPDRIRDFKPRLDKVLVEGGKREMKFITGELNGCSISVVSSGMGTDNIDILINELASIHAGKWNTIRLLRLGTTGSLRAEIEPGRFIISRDALGLDGMLHHYKNHHQSEKEEQFIDEFVAKTEWPKKLARPYLANASLELNIDDTVVEGITLTTNGFYGPQLRALHLEPRLEDVFFEQLKSLKYNGLYISNLEMEMAGIFGLSKLFGMQCAGICVALANRMTHTNVYNSTDPVNQLIDYGLHAFTSIKAQ